MILAAIDIGSNAARLLITEVVRLPGAEPVFTKLNMLRVPFRLGMDVFTTGRIGQERCQLVVDTMKIYADLMRVYKVEHYRACATSAMRDAENGRELISAVRLASGIEIEIISGDEEANLVYENHIAENLSEDKSYLYIDVGGGSTELTFYQNAKHQYQKSFNIGTLRVLNHLVEPRHWEEMREAIVKHIRSHTPRAAIGSGGNINKIFSMSKVKEGKSISIATLESFYAELKPLSVKERMAKYQIREDRADVLVPALEIFCNVLNWADIGEIFVPKISVADGLIKKMYQDLV